jgi:exodeoxyribonuclease VII large subunit
MTTAVSPSTSVSNTPPSLYTIQDALAHFCAAEARGQHRLADVTLHGRVQRLRLGSSGASFMWIGDATGEIEAVVRTRLRSIIPKSLREGQTVEVRGAVKRHWNSAPQLEIRTIRILPDHFPAATTTHHPPLKPVSLPVPAPRPMPDVISTLGIVSSPGSAGLDDVLHVARTRAPWIQIVLCPAALQGEGAAESMVQGILRLHLEPGIDAVLLTRGGATTPTDLAAFFDPMLLRTLRLSRLPIVTAIGHARDLTAADHAATATYATPSLAAVGLFPDRDAIRRELDVLAERIQRQLDSAPLGGRQALSIPTSPASTGLLGTADGISPATLLATARARLAKTASQLEENPGSPAATASLLYTVASDLCLARSILEFPPLPLTVLG